MSFFPTNNQEIFISNRFMNSNLLLIRCSSQFSPPLNTFSIYYILLFYYILFLRHFCPFLGQKCRTLWSKMSHPATFLSNLRFFWSKMSHLTIFLDRNVALSFFLGQKCRTINYQNYPSPMLS